MVQQPKSPGATLGATPLPTTHTRGVTAGGPAEDLSPWRPSPGDPFDHAKAAHLLRRAGFGGKPEEIDATVAIGVDRAIDALLTPGVYVAPHHGTAVLPSGEILNLGALAGQRAMFLYTQVANPYRLQEKMTLFWADHFSVGIEQPQYPEIMGQHIATLRALAMGNFRQMLYAVTIDPAMLLWLDNALSLRTRPNENYARELLELYTMGVFGGYTEHDIREIARALTGHQLLGRNEYTWNNNNHDYTSKTVLGRVINNATPNGFRDLDNVLDVVLQQPATSKYLVQKIWEFFVYENPEQALVDYLAAQWVADNYNVRSLMSRILRSKAFFSSAAIRTLIKNPVEWALGLVHLVGAETGLLYTGLITNVVNMGFPILNYTNPSGLPDGAAWITSQSLIERTNYAQALVQKGGTTNLRANIDARREINRVGLQDATQIVDHYIKYMTDGTTPAAVRTSLIDYMNRIDTGPRPFVISNDTHVNQKVTGLIHLLAATPEFNIN